MLARVRSWWAMILIFRRARMSETAKAPLKLKSARRRIHIGAFSAEERSDKFDEEGRTWNLDGGCVQA